MGSNKAFQEVIDKAEKDRAHDAEQKALLKRDAQDVRVELHNASTARAPPVKKEKKVDGDEDLSMKGYKTTADGKKTSYFHTDISDEAKRLIAEQGFGKPKKLEADEAAVGDSEAKGGGSTWNQAGTYEEKNMSKWAAERLKALLVGLTFEIPTGSGGTISSTAVEDFQGDANISVSRGKRRHLLDVTFAVLFEAKVGDRVGNGKLLFSEVTTDDEP